ncbi:MAG: hypothetical protein LIP09_00905, partial [Bacteroidales bacterium]|nr:hypothetical protein [Bacteroidales bacterium]
MAKDADITIYKPSGEARMAAHIGKGSKREFTLMEKDCVTLKFTAAEATQLHLGDYIEIAGAGRYELTEPYTPEKSKTTGGYDYEITLEAQHRKFKNKLLKFLPFVGTGETSWSYTDSMGAFAKILLDNLRALAYERESDGTEALTSGREGYLWNGKKDWAITWDESVDDTKAFTLTFSDTSILDAIDMIAEELECEWWWEKETLHFGKCEYGGDDPTALSYGTEICGISKKQSKEDYATRLYCYGSDRNLPSTYRKELVFTADTLNDAKDETRDSARELSASFFPKAMRAVGAKDQQTLNLMHTHGGTVSNTAATVENIALTSDTATISGLNSGFWTIGLSAFRPKVTIDAHTGNSDEAVVEVKLTAVYASGATESWTWSATQYLYALGVAIEVTGFQDQSIQLAEETAKLTATATYYLRMGSNSSVGMSVQTMDAGKITASNKYPTYGATGVTIEIVDTLTGETTETITGATYNPDFLASSPTLKLPSGKTWSKGTKFKLPDLNAALVPASYFTSKYAVLDKYTDLTTNGIVNSRLLLPEEDEAGEPLPGYIDVTELESEEEAVERVVTFDEIYPRRTSTVQEVLTEEKTDTQEEQDGSTTYVKWISYRIKDDLFNEENPFDNTYLLDGQDLEITFQSGLLNGLTFGAAYLSDDTFEIQRDDTTLLPNELIKPQAGDTYIISGFNIAMISDAKADYIGSAERELLEEARKYAEELNTDTNTYECTMFCDWAQKQAGADGQCLGIGQRVNLYHKAYFGEGCRESRVIGYEIPLDIPYDNPVYLIGETASYSRLGALESEVKSVGVKAGSAGRASGSTTTIGGSSSSGTGASVEIIKTGDATAETDENVYSALRALEEIKSRALSRLNADTAQGLITFMAGLISNGAVRIDSTLTTLGDITAGADAVISGLLHALGNIKGDGTLEIAGDSEIGGKLTVKDAIEALKTIAA